MGGEVKARSFLGRGSRSQRPIISHMVQALLARFGALIKERSGVVRLVRG